MIIITRMILVTLTGRITRWNYNTNNFILDVYNDKIYNIKKILYFMILTFLISFTYVIKNKNSF